MIVRVLGEGQYDLPEEEAGPFGDLDRALVDAVEHGDEDAFRDGLAELLAEVRTHGRAIGLDMMAPSELVVPGEDATLDEVRALLAEEG